MCEICCAKTDEERIVVRDGLLRKAEVFSRLADHYKLLAYRRIQPHADTPYWDQLKPTAHNAIRTLVEDLL